MDNKNNNNQKPNKAINILAIDDSTTNTTLLRGVLEEEGYNVLIANNAKKAFTMMQKTRFNLILLDLMMPKITGFNFLETMAAKDFDDRIPIIVISAKTSLRDINKAKSMGALDYIVKPVNLQKLVDKVKSVLKNYPN